MPETILALLYIGITIYNTRKVHFYLEQIDEGTWLLTKHIILIAVLLTLIILDIALRISKLNSQVYNVDIDVKKTITEFQDIIWDDDQGLSDSLSSEKEFSFYEDCFTLTRRNNRWRHVPSNTLATGDIIKLMPGDVAPAYVKQIGASQFNDAEIFNSPEEVSVMHDLATKGVPKLESKSKSHCKADGVNSIMIKSENPIDARLQIVKGLSE